MMSRIFLLIILFSIQSFSDILFIDTNNSPKEIEAAKKAAAKRGEKLIVFPESRSRFKSVDLENYLKKLESDGKKLSSVVLSGHNGNGHFTGNFGDMSYESLSKAFQTAPNLTSSVRSMMLWGCYTTNLGSVQNFWKKHFPQLELIAGFDGVAPANDKEAGWKYLEDVLVQEKKLTQSKDEKELKRHFKNLSQINVMNAALCTSENFTSHKKTFKISEAFQACNKLGEEIQSVFNCYFNATEERCKNVPKDTANGEIRKLYNHVQDNYHCNGTTDAYGRTVRLPEPETILRLIFFENVKKNVQKILGDVNFADKFNEQLKKITSESSLLWPDDISSLSRQEILEKLNRLQTLLYGNDFPKHLSPEARVLKNYVSGLGELLGNLSEVPFPMIESVVHADVTNYIKNNYFSSINQLPGTIKDRRENYENYRAKEVVNSTLSESLNQITEIFYRQRDVLIEKHSATTDQKERERIVSEYTAISKNFELDREKQIEKSAPQVLAKLYEEREKNKDYPHEEGKKIFYEALEKEISRFEEYQKKQPPPADAKRDTVPSE